MFDRGGARSMSDDAIWCRNHFMCMNEGAVWAVPRSGLTFRRCGDSLHLIERMPYTDELARAAEAGAAVPRSADALLAYQDEDFALIRSRFEDAGIRVVDGTMEPLS